MGDIKQPLVDEALDDYQQGPYRQATPGTAQKRACHLSGITLTDAFTGNPQLLLAQWRLKSITLTLRVRVDYKMKRM